MLRQLLSILCLSLCATSARAQTVVVPAGIGSRTGNGSDAVGVSDTTARAQYLYDRSATGFTRSMMVTQVSMRMDEGALTAARNDLQISMRMSTRAVDPARIPFANFDLNDGLTVGSWSTTNISLPAVVATGVPQSFFRLPLAAPFRTDVDGTLCIDIKYRTQASGPFGHRIDAEIDRQDRFRREYFGSGCPSAAKTSATGFFVGNQNGLGAYTAVDGVPSSSIVLALLGSQRLDVPLGFSYGGDACRGFTVATLIHPVSFVVPSNSNYARFFWLNAQQLANPQLAGVRAVFQHIFFDSMFMPGTSDAVEVVVGDSKSGNSFRTVYGSSRLQANFDPDSDRASAFVNSAPILGVR